MKPIPKRWSVRKRDLEWQVFDRGTLWDRYANLEEAHTVATQNAVADVLYAEGGLTCLFELKKEAEAQYG